MKKLSYIFLVVLTVMHYGCSEDFLELEPTEYISAEQLDRVPDALSGSLEGAYNYLVETGSRHDGFGHKAVELGLDLMTEDMVFPNPIYGWFSFDYQLDNRNQNYARPAFIWKFYYKVIFQANSILELLPEELDNPKEESFAGQALAMRAWAHYYLVRLFQFTYVGSENAPGVPYKTNLNEVHAARQTVSEVYANIEKDLLQAKDLLRGKTRESKVQIDYNVICGILADMYLTMENYPKAINYADSVIANYPSLMGPEDYLSGFQDINNIEWIWGYDHTIESATTYSSFFSMLDPKKLGYAGIGDYKEIGSKLFNEIRPTDIRKKTIGVQLGGGENIRKLPLAINKFYDSSPALDYTGDYVFMRVAEMYYIKAEAQARNNNEAGAKQTLLDAAIARDPSYTISPLSGEKLLEEIFQHKRIELLGEGKTYFDLKRQKLGIDRRGSNHTEVEKEPVPYTDPRWVYQIPEAELEANNLMSAADQNP